MNYFTHIFNASFFIILAIIILVVALLVVYFESKIREQHHKIVSMLSLVSTLAEDINEMKINFNHLIISGGSQNKQNNSENLGIIQNNTLNLKSSHDTRDSLALIEVSDDESNDESVSDDDGDVSDDDEDVSDDDEDVSDDEDLHDNPDKTNDNEENKLSNEIEDIEFKVDNPLRDDENTNKEKNNIKVLIVNLNDNKLNVNNDSRFNLDDSEDLDNFQPIYENAEIAEEYAKQILSLKYEVEINEQTPELLFHSNEEIYQNNKQDIILEKKKDDNVLQSIKSISINLGDELLAKDDIMDYKKIQLAKLRTIIVEKGLASNSDASKLKKNEILKLLGVE
jgi:hypothetical protein